MPRYSCVGRQVRLRACELTLRCRAMHVCCWHLGSTNQHTVYSGVHSYTNTVWCTTHQCPARACSSSHLTSQTAVAVVAVTAGCTAFTSARAVTAQLRLTHTHMRARKCFDLRKCVPQKPQPGRPSVRGPPCAPLLLGLGSKAATCQTALTHHHSRPTANASPAAGLLKTGLH